MQTVGEIWEGDLFSRRAEAEDLIGYLESVSARPQIRDEGHAHVLAIDTSYGQGKSYFLRRLARHMALDHAVAFVDAWVDDLEDQPMIALAATLDTALEPWTAEHPELGDKMRSFRAKAGRVAKIVGVGLAKRAASFVIMGSGAEALGDELAKLNDVTKDLSKEVVKDSSNDVVNSIAAGFGASMASSMEARIERFREGQRAISEMKVGLSEIVKTLDKAGMKLPITIIIDELDRCRPTYAIKVLEELKHLFDVPGVAFVLGLHGQQLAHSVTAAYGSEFDGQAYLRRFFSRRYILKDVPLTPLVRKLCAELKIPLHRLQILNIADNIDKDHALKADPERIIASYIKSFDLAARDVFVVLEMLQTFMALTGDGPILLPLIIPMIIGYVKGKQVEQLEVINPPDWSYIGQLISHHTNEMQNYSMQAVYEQMKHAANLPVRDLANKVNAGGTTAATQMVAVVRFDAKTQNYPYDPANYSNVLQRVSRFVSS